MEGLKKLLILIIRFEKWVTLMTSNKKVEINKYIIKTIKN